jgi:hypothetical protein
MDKSEVEKLMAESDAVKKLKPSKQGVKRTPDAASSSTDKPAAKAKNKNHKIERR